ncbi:MAG: hypothetical protein ACPGVE_05295, partial [Flavobacteriales bacterium]
MTEVQMNAVASPAQGLIIYCTDCADGAGLYVNGSTDGSSDFAAVGGSGSGTPSVANDCDANGIEGSYVSGFALTGANTFSVTLTNNSFSTATIAFSNSDVTLSGASSGDITVG